MYCKRQHFYAVKPISSSACAQSGKPVNIKKGQFLAPHDMKNVMEKAKMAARTAGLPDDQFMACERGVSFGYNNLVSDMRSLAIMRETGCPVVFDATILCNCRAGRAARPVGSANLCRCWHVLLLLVGIAGLFMETHPDPIQGYV